MIGRRYGRLVVQQVDRSDKNAIRCVCICDCGTQKIVLRNALYGGQTNSCGCLQKERTAQANVKRAKHGLSRTREGVVWRAMIQRCEDEKCEAYPWYGGRGIKVCDRWRESVENFYKDMGPRPGDNFELDREDSYGDYTPSNCRWVPRIINNRNRAVVCRLTVDGETKTLVEWAEITGLKPATIYARKKKGWTDEKAVREPLRYA